LPPLKMRDSIKLYGAEELMAKTDVFIFDCDGVLWYHHCA